MIEVVVLREFHDKDDFAKTYKVGDVVSFEGNRAKELAALGLVKVKTADKAKSGKENKE